ncbi:MAG: hypothetical protein WBC60_00165 [Cognaticolwellia sp.]
MTELGPKTQISYKSTFNKYVTPYKNIDIERYRYTDWIVYFDWVKKESSSANAGSVLKRFKAVANWAKTRGQIVKRNWISEIYEGQTLLEYDYTERYGGVNFPTVGSFIVSDFVEMPANYLKGMNTEQGRAIPLALSKWLSLSENGYMRCFPKDEAFHAGVEKDFKKKLEEKA